MPPVVPISFQTYPPALERLIPLSMTPGVVVRSVFRQPLVWHCACLITAVNRTMAQKET